jgi:hypothetical protein
MHPSHKVPWCLPNPPGQVFAFKLSRTWVSRLVRARSDQPNQWRRESQRQSGGYGSPVGVREEVRVDEPHHWAPWPM